MISLISKRVHFKKQPLSAFFSSVTVLIEYNEKKHEAYAALFFFFQQVGRHFLWLIDYGYSMSNFENDVLIIFPSQISKSICKERFNLRYWQSPKQICVLL